jgi:thiol:disulfide interchange protein DsbD
MTLQRSLLKNLLLFPLLLASALPGRAQQHIKFEAALQPPDARAGEGAQVVIKATIDPPYHLYSLTQPDGGPNRTTIELKDGSALVAAGKPIQPPFKSEYDQGFKITVEEYEKGVSFGMPVTLKPGISGEQKAAISFHYQLCNQKNCLIPQTVEIPVAFTVAPGAARPDHLAAITTIPPQDFPQEQNKPAVGATAPGTASGAVAGTATAPSKDAARDRIRQAQDQGLLSFMGLAFGAGFLALLTPCVFPLIPITVSFFAKRQKQNKAQGVRDALAYCLGIIGTFTVLGVAMSVIFKATGVQQIATNPYINVALAVLFIVLGINLMGGFQVTLPYSLTSRVPSGTQKAGIIGPLLMGFTFTLTSFTCTVAFVGTLLAAAAQGNLFYPIMGMLAFSTAFSLPFFLLALFPQYLASLPKSGSWLVTVKAFMGFVELAAGLKFLSNTDLVWQLGLLTRPVFLAIWAGIGIITGLYLINLLRLPHDDSLKIGWGRRIFGVLSVGAALACLWAINDRPLPLLDAYLPPSPYPGAPGKVGALTWLSDYDQALAKAKTKHKPILINFTGVTCTNCRWMENNVFPLPNVIDELEDYVRVELYTDRTKPEDARNRDLEQKLTGVASLPVYVIVTPDGKVQQIHQDKTQGNDPIKGGVEFAQFLSQGRNAMISSTKQ